AAVAIGLGLIIGKPLGVLVASYLVIRAKIARLPKGADWAHLAGAAIFTGIGLTMSLFITELAFAGTPHEPFARLAIFASSMVMASTGLVFLLRKSKAASRAEITRA